MNYFKGQVPIHWLSLGDRTDNEFSYIRKRKRGREAEGRERERALQRVPSGTFYYMFLFQLFANYFRSSLYFVFSSSPIALGFVCICVVPARTHNNVVDTRYNFCMLCVSRADFDRHCQSILLCIFFFRVLPLSKTRFKLIAMMKITQQKNIRKWKTVNPSATAN